MVDSNGLPIKDQDILLSSHKRGAVRYRLHVYQYGAQVECLDLPNTWYEFTFFKKLRPNFVLQITS